MRSFRFLLSRRWALFAIAVVVLVAGAWWLGQWQFDRLENRRESNGIISANEGADPQPVAEVLSTDSPVQSEDEWRRVTATGTYDVEHTVVWRYRTDDNGASGIDIVVPLVTDEGPTLLVDRGWMPVQRQTEYPDVPEPPAGEVTVTAWVRADGTGDSTSVDEVDGHWGTRAVSSQEIGPAIDQDVYQGFVQLESEDPEPAEALRANELPELSEGPHFFYGIQWWFFGALAVFGFFYLLYDERRSQRRKAADAADTAPAETPAAGPPDTEPSPRQRRRAEKLARKQAVRAAYQQAYRDARGHQDAPDQNGQSDRSAPPSTGTIAPDTNDAAGESTNAATRPNSSDRP